MEISAGFFLDTFWIPECSLVLFVKTSNLMSMQKLDHFGDAFGILDGSHRCEI